MLLFGLSFPAQFDFFFYFLCAPLRVDQFKHLTLLVTKKLIGQEIDYMDIMAKAFGTLGNLPPMQTEAGLRLVVWAPNFSHAHISSTRTPY